VQYVGSVDIKDFHPISLVGGVYKIIMVLVNRLKAVLGKIISNLQNVVIDST
jgi:hypothetical protein